MAMLRGKTVVVTGAASGIGRGIALAASFHGAKAIILGDIDSTPNEPGPSTLELLQLAGTPCAFVESDVTSQADMLNLIAASESFGGVDVMACNAGIGTAGDDGDVTPETLQRILAVNVHGVLNGCQSAARQMMANKKNGSIIVTSSMGGLRGSGFTVAYSTSKGAVNSLVRSLADAWGPDGIRVNAVCPGIIETAMLKQSPAVAAACEPMRQRMPLRRYGQPREIGDAVVWLGSDMSSFVTGVTLPVDGGQTAVI